jgi:hypothetical protein
MGTRLDAAMSETLAPEGFGLEFLHWLRNATERAWAQVGVEDYMADEPNARGFRIGS